MKTINGSFTTKIEDVTFSVDYSAEVELNPTGTDPMQTSVVITVQSVEHQNEEMLELLNENIIERIEEKCAEDFNS